MSSQPSQAPKDFHPDFGLDDITVQTPTGSKSLYRDVNFPTLNIGRTYSLHIESARPADLLNLSLQAKPVWAQVDYLKAGTFEDDPGWLLYPLTSNVSPGIYNWTLKGYPQEILAADDKGWTIIVENSRSLNRTYSSRFAIKALSTTPLSDFKDDTLHFNGDFHRKEGARSIEVGRTYNISFFVPPGAARPRLFVDYWLSRNGPKQATSSWPLASVVEEDYYIWTVSEEFGNWFKGLNIPNHYIWLILNIDGKSIPSVNFVVRSDSPENPLSSSTPSASELPISALPSSLVPVTFFPSGLISKQSSEPQNFPLSSYSASSSYLIPTAGPISLAPTQSIAANVRPTLQEYPINPTSYSSSSSPLTSSTTAFTAIQSSSSSLPDRPLVEILNSLPDAKFSVSPSSPDATESLSSVFTNEKPFEISSVVKNLPTSSSDLVTSRPVITSSSSGVQPSTFLPLGKSQLSNLSPSNLFPYGPYIPIYVPTVEVTFVTIPGPTHTIFVQRVVYVTPRATAIPSPLPPSRDTPLISPGMLCRLKPSSAHLLICALLCGLLCSLLAIELGLRFCYRLRKVRIRRRLNHLRVLMRRRDHVGDLATVPLEDPPRYSSLFSTFWKDVWVIDEKELVRKLESSK